MLCIGKQVESPKPKPNTQSKEPKTKAANRILNTAEILLPKELNTSGEKGPVFRSAAPEKKLNSKLKKLPLRTYTEIILIRQTNKLIWMTEQL